MTNSEIARILRDIATILEIKQANPFRVRAYERAALNIESLSSDIEGYVLENRLKEIPGIGPDLSEKIKEIVRTGRLKFYEQLKKTIPQGVLELLKIPSIGPKTAKLLCEKLKIKDISGLKSAIKQNKLKDIFGIKEKTVENILKGIALVERGQKRMLLSEAFELAGQFRAPLSRLKEIKNISAAGSLRRHKETVRDIDILVASSTPKKVMDVFTQIPEVADILAKGPTKSAVRTKTGKQIDCRVTEEGAYGAALLYFTGSKDFNIKLRKIAIQKGLKLNEYGLFKGDKLVAGKTEEEIFKRLGISYIEPELRENTGEIELAAKGRLPRLIEQNDLRADLHIHSRWSDGLNSIEEMANACKKMGYTYAAICDHSQGLKVAAGLSTGELKKKKKEIDRLNRRMSGFRILYGTELDIDVQGNLDYKDDTLKEFDLVVAAIHTGFKQSRTALTARLVKACKSKFVHIIAHPTGRLWGERDAYDIDLEEVFRAAADTNTHMEINSFPQRLDLNDANSRRAKEIGVKLAVSSDSHSTSQLETIQFGIFTARRGWLTKDDVINTLALEELLKEIKK